MDYALQLLIPILGGLLLGLWLHDHYGVSPIWTVLLAVLGMIAGLGIMYKRLMYPHSQEKEDPKGDAASSRKPEE